MSCGAAGPASGAAGLYDRVLRHLDGASLLMGGPDEVAVAVADVLTRGRPPRHKRIGPGAGWLRLADRVVPDARIWPLGTLVVEFGFSPHPAGTQMVVREDPCAGPIGLPGVRPVVTALIRLRNLEMSRRYREMVDERA